MVNYKENTNFHTRHIKNLHNQLVPEPKSEETACIMASISISRLRDGVIYFSGLVCKSTWRGCFRLIQIFIHSALCSSASIVWLLLYHLIMIAIYNISCALLSFPDYVLLRCNDVRSSK